VLHLASELRIEVSGRLTLGQKNGDRVVQWRGVAAINKGFDVPTLIMDATLPEERLLRVYHPQVEVVADVRVAMPEHTRITQVLGAPTSSRKLAAETEAHVVEVGRYVLRRWVELGRPSTLVIAQIEAEKRLRERLPQCIHLRHYNDVCGDDQYRGVRLLVLVGRTAPGPAGPELLAGTLTGRQPLARPLRRCGHKSRRHNWCRRPGAGAGSIATRRRRSTLTCSLTMRCR
jgi:hypothetical protein